jgi:hypothetical protein
MDAVATDRKKLPGLTYRISTIRSTSVPQFFSQITATAGKSRHACENLSVMPHTAGVFPSPVPVVQVKCRAQQCGKPGRWGV